MTYTGHNIDVAMLLAKKNSWKEKVIILHSTRRGFCVSYFHTPAEFIWGMRQVCTVNQGVVTPSYDVDTDYIYKADERAKKELRRED